MNSILKVLTEPIFRIQDLDQEPNQLLFDPQCRFLILEHLRQLAHVVDRWLLGQLDADDACELVDQVDFVLEALVVLGLTLD